MGSNKKNIRGVESNEILHQKDYFRDVRPLRHHVASVFKNTDHVNIILLVLALFVFMFPAAYMFSIVSVVLVSSVHYFIGGEKKLPFRLPKTANKIDYNDPAPGRKKFNESSGVFFLGNEWRENYELWLKDKDILTHMLIFGTTGSGKTESLVSLAFNALAMGAGLFYIDPKAAPKLAFQIYVLSRICGRDDDYRVLNYGTGNKSLKKYTPTRMSNTQNPFAFGSAESLTQLLVSLIPSSEGGNAIFSQNAQTLITALMYALVELRDKGELELSITTVREYATLQKYHELASRTDLSEGTLGSLKSFLTSVGWQEGKPLNSQPKSLPEQFGYARMYFGLTLQSFADSYGHIYASPMGEIDMYDVIVHRRIMVTMLPSLEKAPQELENLGKIALSAVRNAIAVGLGDKIEGSAEDVLESLPTDAPAPFLTIVDEYAAIPTEGFAEILTQGRGLGVSAIVASQDYDGITKADEKGAGQIVANTKIKLCMTLEDPKNTWDLFNSIAGEAVVMQTQGFTKDKEEKLSLSYKDQMSASPEKVSRLHIQDLQEQIEGEFHAFFKGDVVRGNVFFANPPLPSKSQLRIIQMLQVSSPPKETLEKKYGTIDELANNIEARVKESREKRKTRIACDFSQLYYLPNSLALKSFKDPIEKAIVSIMLWREENNHKSEEDSFEDGGSNMKAYPEESGISSNQQDIDDHDLEEYTENIDPHNLVDENKDNYDENVENEHQHIENAKANQENEERLNDECKQKNHINKPKIYETKKESSNTDESTSNAGLEDFKEKLNEFEHHFMADSFFEGADKDITAIESEYVDDDYAEKRAQAVIDKAKSTNYYPPEHYPQAKKEEISEKIDKLLGESF